MGGSCCCPRSEYSEQDSYPNGSTHANCFFLPCCARWCVRVYSSCFDPGEVRDSPSTNQQVPSSGGSGLLGPTSLNTSVPDTFRAPPRPLPYGTEFMYLRIPRDGLLSQRDKSGMSQLHTVQGEPLRQRGNSGGGSDPLTQLQGQNGGKEDFDEQTQGYRPNSPSKPPLAKVVERNKSMLSLADDEDICPTCLDGYTEENPKIPTACGHHFHLGCIYEWKERSKYCPMCDKEMIFSERF